MHPLAPAPHLKRVQLRFGRDVETTIYNTLPHYMGAILREPYPLPIDFIAGTSCEGLHLAGLDATRRMVGNRLEMIEGGHL